MAAMIVQKILKSHNTHNSNGHNDYVELSQHEGHTKLVQTHYGNGRNDYAEFLHSEHPKSQREKLA